MLRLFGSSVGLCTRSGVFLSTRYATDHHVFRAWVVIHKSDFPSGTALSVDLDAFLEFHTRSMRVFRDSIRFLLFFFLPSERILEESIFEVFSTLNSQLYDLQSNQVENRKLVFFLGYFSKSFGLFQINNTFNGRIYELP